VASFVAWLFHAEIALTAGRSPRAVLARSDWREEAGVRDTRAMGPTTATSVRVLSAVLLLLALGTALADDTSAGTLDRIRRTGSIRVANREDAPPFSYKDSVGQPAGFMIGLCTAVAKKLSSQLNVPSLNVAYTSVTALIPLDTVQQPEPDLFCEPTSVTLSRREKVDFSTATFVDGASAMIRPDGPRESQALTGQKIGVLAGATTDQALRGTLAKSAITAQVVPARSHEEGVAMIDDGRISTYFADRPILVMLIRTSKEPEKPTLDAYLTVEPSALALPRGDEDFRPEIDRVLSTTYGSGTLGPMFPRVFGSNFRPGPILRSPYPISAFPE
jgi:ABC-type amino acid transport substrate-binding protein